ncbi:MULTISPECIES: hypothetical protein [Pseudomonas]|uniref:hypothetical protein n=1 Tax=Pseudomonas TaxID=286 RepID=UPI001E4C64B6|nr:MULTISPECIES: hypothetical protein [Pseudomonas]MCE1113981.1 hypothetical protein [Pseudomonas sp. NMI795_08]
MAVQSARLSTGIGKPLVLLNEYLTGIDLAQRVSTEVVIEARAFTCVAVNMAALFMVYDDQVGS